MKNYDFIAVGDAVVDDFIRIDDAEVTTDDHGANAKLCLRFGDKVPFESHEVLYAVGNSANAAVSAARLGLSSALISTIGKDTNGELCIDALKENNVSTEFVDMAFGMPTNYHYVLWHIPERTILVKHAEYPRSFPVDIGNPKWMYLTSLGQNTEEFHDEVLAWLLAHPETKLAFQPGTFQMKLGTDRLKGIYQRSDAFFCNVEEAQRILKTDIADPKKLMDGIHELGPKIVVVTDGINGAYAREENGTYWFMPIYPNTPYERTGAGDSFSSTFTIALSKGKSISEALLWAPINAKSVTEQVGAQKGLLPQKEIEEWLAKAPTDYAPRKI